ncbi:MAG TPA: DUF2905 domain-containing protein [Candidatus Limnocylindrales bacterium]|nr:DUF2905 domain-containing protein [Candidatus Limnocylindrales bacterium]
MEGLDGIGRTLMAVGAVLLVLGFLFVLAPRVPFLGRLPGDLTIEREGVRIYLPFATMILVSIVASLLLGLLNRR